MRRFLITLALLSACLPACKKDEPMPTPAPTPNLLEPPPPPPTPPKVELPPPPPLPKTPLGLPEAKPVEGNLLTAEKVALGKELFFDKRLSKDGTAACVTCHLPEKGWPGVLPLSTKAGAIANPRPSPSLYNMAYHTLYYWDGRAPTLEKQVEAAWKGQMGGDPVAVAAVLDATPPARAAFERAFNQGPTPENIAQAMASFVRTIKSGDSAWDRYEKGDQTAVSADAILGYALFTTKAQCSLCHTPPLFSDTLFHNVGIGSEQLEPDPGRAKASNDAGDTGAFQTPGLRSITKTAPYFHDGSEATLEGAVKLMVAGGKKNSRLDPKLKPVKLSDKEFKQLMAFLQALDGEENFVAPTSRPTTLPTAAPTKEAPHEAAPH